MAEPSSQEVTCLLQAWSNGDQSAFDQLFPLVEQELYRLARGYMRRERPDHTLQTTALINEAYLCLAHWKEAKWNSRNHFIGVAAIAMRRLLVSHARQRPLKVGAKVELEEALTLTQEPTADVVALDLALRALEKADPRKSRVVELRYFGGLTLEEIAEVLQVTVRTVSREWSVAKAWLYHELSQPSPDES